MTRTERAETPEESSRSNDDAGSPRAREALEQPAQAEAGNALGDATLQSLGGALNLQASAGRFQIDVNGQTLNFRADQTLNDVLSGISAPGTGARASLDPRERRINVESTNGQPLRIEDREGNLSSGLGIEVTPPAEVNGALTRDLQDYANGINRALTAIESRRGTTGQPETEEILNDLQSALNSNFSRSTDGSVTTLGDLGFSRNNGQVQLDQQRLQTLTESNPDQVNQVAQSVTSPNGEAMLNAGARVAQALESSIGEARASTQEVRVRAEISRLQVRQQTLTLDRISVEQIRERVARQSDALQQTAEGLADRLPDGMPQQNREVMDFANDVRPPRPQPRPAIATALPVPNSSASLLGLSSFGMSGS
ncbi:MAG: flagellar filament capping protein FliD [Candidatus Sericytochromatia bacterium]|nr:flagellar filament capping protein FliD [Candidatus Sericytochromatia bacterium]